MSMVMAENEDQRQTEEGRRAQARRIIEHFGPATTVDDWKVFAELWVMNALEYRERRHAALRAILLATGPFDLITGSGWKCPIPTCEGTTRHEPDCPWGTLVDEARALVGTTL